MKKFILMIAGAVLAGASLVSQAQQADTIESKIEQMGTPKYLKVTALSARTRNKQLVLNFTIRNTDDRDNNAYYRVRWLDESGDRVWDDEPWKPMLFHGNQNVQVRAVAPTTKAKDFMLEFSAEANRRN